MNSSKTKSCMEGMVRLKPENNAGHRTAERIDCVLMAICKVFSYLGAFSLILIMLVAFFNVIGEKLFHQGIPASTEIVQYFHIPVVFTAAAWVNLDTGHTKIDLLSSHFPGAMQAVIDALANLAGAFICGFVAWLGISRVANFYSIHKMSSVTGSGFVLWPFALILVIGFALLAVTFLWRIIRRFIRLEPSAPAAGPSPEPDGDREEGTV